MKWKKHDPNAELEAKADAWAETHLEKNALADHNRQEANDWASIYARQNAKKAELPSAMIETAQAVAIGTVAAHSALKQQEEISR